METSTVHRKLGFIVSLAVSSAVFIVLWCAARDAEKVLELVRAWEADGPHTTVLGSVRGLLADACWLGPLRPSSQRDPLAECGLSSLRGGGGVGWQDIVSTGRRLACLQRQVQLALDEHEAFAARLLVAAACCLVLLVVCCAFMLRRCWTRRTLPREHEKLPPSREESVECTHFNDVH